MKRIPLVIIAFFISVCSFAQSVPTQIFIKCQLQAGGQICWSAKEDSAEMVYLVQQFRWNKWVNWDTIIGETQTDVAAYSVNVSKYFHSGENVFRICPFTNGKVLKFSEKIIYPGENFGELLEQVVYPSKTDDLIQFKRETYYELYDKNGDVVRQGYGKSFSRKGLDGDVYYLNYDNKTTSVTWYYKVE